MQVFFIIAIAMAIIVMLLRKHWSIGPAILAGGLFIWLSTGPSFDKLLTAAVSTVSERRTYDLILALYFVMCLEIELRTSGTLSGMIVALQRLFSNQKISLAIMPAFLGLLPSLGGARFSAPIVEEICKNDSVPPDSQATINFWYRHAFEYANPINPGMIMACSIAMVPLSALIVNMGWLTIFTFLAGWLFCLRPLKIKPPHISDSKPEEINKNLFDVFLCLFPVILNFFLVIFFDFGAASSMAVAAVGMIFVLKNTRRVINVKTVFRDAIDKKMLLNILAILYFIQILAVTGTLNSLVQAFQSSPLPLGVIIAAISFLVGMLTGTSQGHAAIALPIVAGVAPGNLDYIALAMVFGIAGQMLTPTHICLLVSLDYFKVSLFRVLRPVLSMELLLVTVFLVKTFLLF